MDMVNPEIILILQLTCEYPFSLPSTMNCALFIYLTDMRMQMSVFTSIYYITGLYETPDLA